MTLPPDSFIVSLEMGGKPYSLSIVALGKIKSHLAQFMEEDTLDSVEKVLTQIKEDYYAYRSRVTRIDSAEGDYNFTFKLITEKTIVQ